MTNQRNYGRASDYHGPSVVLRAKGRVAKLGNARIVACVGLGYNEGRSYENQQFRHPELTLRTVDSDGETNICGLNVTLRFQSHVVNRGADVVGSRGFLAAFKGPWVHAYGGDLQAKYSYHHDGKMISRMIALIDRARKAAPRNSGRCQLLHLISGLQRCGVEVRVWSEALDATRARRTKSDSHLPPHMRERNTYTYGGDL